MAELPFSGSSLGTRREHLVHAISFNAARAAAALRAFVSLLIITVAMLAGDVAAAAPPVPTPIGPVNGAGVTVPATMSWSAVSDPGGAAIIGYNWRVSASSGMTPLVFADSTGGTTTQDTLSGLPAGTYFWQVQAANSAGEQSEWSVEQAFTITGVGPGTPASPVLDPTRGYSTFHPAESVHFSWSAVAGAPTYRLEVSNDPAFPVGKPGVVFFWNENIRTTGDAFVHHPSLGEGTFYARVFATDSDFAGGIRSLPSNVIEYTVFYNNPIGPAPVLQSPVAGETLTLPVTLSWAHVPNPQDSGYAWEVAKDPNFTTIEASNNQYTEPRAVMLSLTAGPKYWRVLSQHGLSSLNPQTGATTNANTAWSATGRFTISSAPPVPVSIALEGIDPPQRVYSGVRRLVAVQLSAAPGAGGATVSLSSSNPAIASVPATLTLPSGFAFAEFEIPIGQVTAPTPVTLSATLNGTTASGQFNVLPPTLNDDPLQSSPTIATGGAAMTGYVDLEGFGFAPAGGFLVNLASNNQAARVPASVTIPAGTRGTTFPIETSAVTTATGVTITASRNGVTTLLPIRLMPGAAPTSFFVRPIATTKDSQGIINTAEGVGFDQTMQVTSSDPDLADVPKVATASSGSGIGFFNIVTSPVATQKLVTISVSGGGVTLSAPLMLYPSLPALGALSVAPASVTGGATATGTVRLASPAPAGGVAINLSSNLPLKASVPASVTVPSGATSADFTITTFPSAATTVQLSAALNNQFQFAAITVGPPAPPPTPAAPSLIAPAANATPAQPVSFDWNDVANATSYEIQVDDSSTISAPFRASQIVSGSQASIGGLPAIRLWWRVRARNSAGVFGPFSATRRFTPRAQGAVAALSALSVSPGSVVGPAAATGTATLTAAAPSGGAVVALSSSNPAVASVPASVTIAAGSTSASFSVTASAVGTNSAITLTGSYNGTSRTTALTVTPVPPPPPPASLSGLTLNPASVTGGTASQGRVTMTSAAPSGGAVVALSSNATAASVPASVTVPAGATSATFTVTTSAPGTATAATISAALAGVTRTATLAVNPPGTTATLTVTATGRGGERVTSNPAGINVAVGSSQSAGFASGAPVTLSATNSRDVVWSGACSSGGNKTKSCTFTLSANASVNANVQ